MLHCDSDVYNRSTYIFSRYYNRAFVIYKLIKCLIPAWWSRCSTELLVHSMNIVYYSISFLNVDVTLLGVYSDVLPVL